jgi:thiol-disulfide isomerase/thioredoxin
MLKTQIRFAFVSLALLLSACGNVTPTPKTMMESTATPDTMMHDTATPDTMMQATATPDAMMHDTATPDAMMHDTATPDAMMHDTATPDAMMHDTATPDAMMHDTATPDAMMALPGWFGAALTDARTGGSFSINDFKGKVVLVETMAVWCTNCLAQQNEIKALHDKLGMQPDFVSISLDIDPNENRDTLKAYLDKTSFDWAYAVAPVDVVREIGSLYTAQFLNPTSTPILIVDRHGVAHPLPFGIKNAADLFKAVDMYLREGV